MLLHYFFLFTTFTSTLHNVVYPKREEGDEYVCLYICVTSNLESLANKMNISSTSLP